jgi:hypothetical protein
MEQSRSVAAGLESDQSLWRDLGNGAAEAWLRLTVRAVPGAVAGVVLFNETVAAHWPNQLPAAPGLVAIGRLAIEGGRGSAQERPGRAALIAYPVLVDGQAIGAAALELSAKPTPDLRAAMRQLQWASAWLRDHRRAQITAQQAVVIERQSLALDLLAAALEQPGFAAACRLAATELATRLGCERVSLGFVRHGRTVIAALSHTASFGRRLNLLRLLAGAMDEAVDQQAIILHPATDQPLATRAHAALAGAGAGAVVLTVPMAVAGRFIGAATFERAADQPFDQTTVELAEAITAILGPALLDKREVDRNLALKALDALGRQAARLFGPAYLGRKLALLAIVALALLGNFATATYRIGAEGRVEGTVQRAITAPFDGFVREAPARAGAIVQKGSLIVALDDRDLVLERGRWVTERQQHIDEYGEALSKEHRADALRFLNQRDQADAQIRLVDEQLARARINAPFDGLVVSGDLSQSIGAPVRRGDVLFEIAPLHDYRVELMVNENQIADVEPGQRGQILITALPDQSFGFTVERVTPVAIAHEGRMVFKVDAALTSSSDRLRPGMEGVGKIAVTRRRVVWIWFRSLIHWITITSWSVL